MRACAFARLVGAVISNGSMSADMHDKLVFTHTIDVDAARRDMVLLGLTVSRFHTRHITRLSNRCRLPCNRRSSTLEYAIIADDVVFPQAFTNENCPRDVLREFVGALLGGDFLTPVFVDTLQLYRIRERLRGASTNVAFNRCAAAAVDPLRCVR